MRWRPANCRPQAYLEGGDRPNDWHMSCNSLDDGPLGPRNLGDCAMSTFDPFLPLSSPGCPCGAHRSEAEHNHAMQMELGRHLQLVTPENQYKFKAYPNAVTTAALRKIYAVK
jgi:hypothetical protein